MIFSPEIWIRISPLLNQALDLEPALRTGWLESLPPEHSDLRETLRQLLQVETGLDTRDFLPCLTQVDDIRRLAEATAAIARVIETLTKQRCCDGTRSRGLIACADVAMCAQRFGAARIDNGEPHPDTLEARKH